MGEAGSERATTTRRPLVSAGGVADADGAGRGWPAPIRLPPSMMHAAAERLAADASVVGAREAGRRMIEAARSHGVDLSMIWGTVDGDAGGTPIRVREACLVVPGSGRTAMVVVSGPRAGTTPAASRAERSACIARALADLAELGRGGAAPIVLAQALPEPGDAWAIEAFREAGFIHVADLAYMRRPLPGRGLPAGAAKPTWPPAVTVRTVRGARPGEPDRGPLIEALERSYESTLDCPRLCGLRPTSDVLDSHLATGRWEGRHWRLVLLDGTPHGCLLLSPCPEHGSVELVYLGLSRELRGRGVARALLGVGLSNLSPADGDHVACAVDTRNAPAIRLYERFGFTSFASRVALVRPVERGAAAQDSGATRVAHG